MKAYIAFFKLRFNLGLQYRGAALAGVATQVAWGFLNCMLFLAFYNEYPSSYPMGIDEVISFVWLRQALLGLFMLWSFEPEIFRMITSGDVSYELCKPQDIYHMWFARSMAGRLANVVLRMGPVFLAGFMLPKPYGLSLPYNFIQFLLFLFSLCLSFLVVVAFSMLIYSLCFFTTSPLGLRIFAVSFGELLSGDILPLPFFPDKIRQVIELLPFASMGNVPLRLYSGNIKGMDSIPYILLQLMWIVLLIAIGRGVCHKALRNIAVMGG